MEEGRNTQDPVHGGMYSELDHVLRQWSAPMGAAESHGLLCGMLCGPDDVSAEDWLLEVFGRSEPGSGEGLGLLLDVRAETVRQLYAGQFEFAPLLPDDNQSLGERSVALGEWCEGFLLGLSLAGLEDLSRLSAESREVVTDLSEFTRIEAEPETGEEAESAYAELVEYLRAGVTLLHEEVHPQILGGGDTIH